MRIPSCPRAHPLLESDRGVCAGGHPRAAEAGARMLAAGGNAIDAVVAAAFAGFVVEQVDCGVGGFAHVSMWLQAPRAMLSVDGYVRAPAAATAGMFELAGDVPATYYGHPVTCGDRARHGPLAVAVPGAVAGLCDAHAMAGTLPLAQVLEPAIELADRGVPFTWRDALAVAAHAERIRQDPDTAAVLLPGGAVPRIPVQHDDGARMDTRALARTLRAIAQRGKAGFYQGPVADAIDRHMQAAGGILSARDLAAYRPRILREPPARYRDHAYVSCFDHVAYEALNILDGFALGRLDPDGFAHRHLVAEALGAAFTDCMAHYGDPDFVRSPVGGLAHPGFAARRRAGLDRARALPRPIAPADPWPFEDGSQAPVRLPGPISLADRSGTSQMVAADRHGNLAAVCTAIGWDYGALVHVPEAGVFLNGGMQCFDPRPGRPSSIAPGKMPMFGAPTVVAARDGQGRLASAGSGGYRIETAVLHTLVHAIDHGMDLAAAIDHARVHCQGGETFVDARIPAAVADALAAAGHQVVRLEEDASTWHFGRVCAVAIDPARGTISASAGPPWMTGLAAI